MAVIGWGKPRIFIKELGAVGAKWVEVPTPVEDSTELATEKGDKQEAKLEGGANEDVRYNKNTYALTFNIRAAKNRKKLMKDEDGIITSNYSILLQPEDKDIDGISIEKAQVSVEDTWSAEEGGVWIYTFDALQPEEGTQVKYGKIVVTGEGDELNVAFTETTYE